MDEESRVPAAETSPPPRTWRFGRYLVAYRGNLTRQEAARRSGLPEVLWAKVENASESDPEPEPLPPAIVASMCAAVRADVATGLELAGHESGSYPHLIDRPPVFSSLAHLTNPITGPYIATPHVVTAALGEDAVATRPQMAAVYRRLAESNRQVADQIDQEPPDSRSEYWSGYAAAIRAVAEQQELAADPGLIA